MKKVWADPVWSKVISVGIVAIISFGWAFIKSQIEGITIYSSLKFCIEFVYSIILKTINFEIKFWWIIVALTVFIGILYIIDRIQIKKPNLPKCDSYVKDTFKGMIWTWEWKWNNSEKVWNVSNLEAHCPKCETLMIQKSYFSGEVGFECPRCSFIHEPNDVFALRKIELLIIDTVRRNKTDLIN